MKNSRYIYCTFHNLNIRRFCFSYGYLNTHFGLTSYTLMTGELKQKAAVTIFIMIRRTQKTFCNVVFIKIVVKIVFILQSFNKTNKKYLLYLPKIE